MASLHDLGTPAKLLKQRMSATADLRSLPWLERLFFRRTFNGEAIRLGPKQQWLGRSWDLRLAAVNDIVYKIAIETGTSSRADAEDLSLTVLSELEKVLGAYTKPDDAIFAWDVPDGNVILQLTTVGGERRIMLFLTSPIVRQFAR
jgi:hypothetical protein